VGSIRTASFDANDLNAKKLAAEVDAYDQDKETDEVEWKMRYESERSFLSLFCVQ
jgi:hypothetical protein